MPSHAHGCRFLEGRKEDFFRDRREDAPALCRPAGQGGDPETTRTLDEELYFQRAVQTYLWSLPAVNMFAMKEGQAKTFGEGYQVLAVFEKRLKPNTLITTPNSDVIYGIGKYAVIRDHTGGVFGLYKPAG